MSEQIDTEKNEEFWADLKNKRNSSESELSDLLCIVSPNKKGFWEADVYYKGWEEGLTPDWCCSCKIGGTKEQVIKKVKEHFPSPKIVDGVTGHCNDCGEEHFLLETKCEECGGLIADT